MIDGENFFDQPLKMILEHTFEDSKKLQLVKGLITQLTVY